MIVLNIGSGNGWLPNDNKNITWTIVNLPLTRSQRKYVDGLMQEGRNPIANALELRFLALTHRWVNTRKT